MSKTLAKTYAEQLREIVDDYRESGEPWPTTARDIAVWGYNNDLLAPKTGGIIKQIAQDISRAMREEYYTDPQGRTVRTKHAASLLVGGRQKMLWDDIRTANPEHMEKSLKLRRQQIVGDCSQLKRDQDSYNDNNAHGAQIQLSFNFEKDIAERDTLEDYGSKMAAKKPR